MNEEMLMALLSRLQAQPDATGVNTPPFANEDPNSDDELRTRAAEAEYNRGQVNRGSGQYGGETSRETQRRWTDADRWARIRDIAQAELDRRMGQSQEQGQQVESILGGR